MCAAAVLLGGGGTTAEAASQIINPTGGTNATNGLRVTLLDNTQLQVLRVNQGQVYAPGQPTNGNSPNSSLYNGVFLAVGNTVYGPRSTVANNNITPMTDWTLGSQTAVAGAGTSANPWTVVTTVRTGAAATAFQVRVTTQYVAGDSFFTESVQVTPPASNTSQVRFYHLIDTYLQGSDTGPGYVLPATGTPTVVGTFQATTVYEEFISGSRPWNDWYTGQYSTMFSRLDGAGSLNMTVTTTNTDNGIGVQWNLGAITAPQSWDYRVSFRPNARCTNNSTCSGATPACNTATGDCVAAAVTLTNPPAGMSITTTNQSVAITGTGVPGQTITVREGAATICTATVAVAGTWSCTPTTPLSIATHNITASNLTASSMGTIVVQCGTNMQCGTGQVCSMGACISPACLGNFGQGTARDCTTATPVCTNPGTAAAACAACTMGQVYNTTTRVCVAPAVNLTNPPAGGSANTMNRRQPITGTGVPGQTVNVADGGTTLCAAAAVNAMGNWTCTPTADLAFGSHAISATSGSASSSGTLVVQCGVGAMCPTGQVCSMGACTVPSCTGNSGAGSARDCPIATPICLLPGTALASCNACALGTVYNTNTRLCVAPTVSLTQPPAGGTLATTDTALPVTGTGVPGQTVTVSEMGTTVCTATVNMMGRWTCTPATAWTIDTHPLTATSSGATSSGTLVVRCTMNAQCGGILVCSMGACVTPACTGNNGAGTARDCPAATPLCTNPGTATAACTACPMGQVFNPVSRVCTPSAVTLSTPPAGGSLTTTNLMQPIAGSGVPAQTVTVREGGATICTATVQNDSSWTCTPAANFSIGSHVLVATSGSASSSGTLVVRCTADTQCSMGQVCGGGICVTPSCLGNNGAGTTADCPAATPLCSMPGTAGASCTTCPAGQVFNTATRVCAPEAVALTNPPAGGSADSMTQTPMITGTGVPGQLVSVSEGASVICSATVLAAGTWSCSPASPLSIGAHPLVATSGAATSMGTLNVLCTMNSQCTGTQLCNTTSGACFMPMCTGSAGSTTTVACPAATPVCTNPGTPTSMCNACPAGQFYDATMQRCRTCAVATQTTDCMTPATACDTTAMQCVMPMVTVATPANGSSTANGSPPITGVATPGQAVTVIVDGMALGTTTADAMGNWTFTPTTPLAQGMHTASARITIGIADTLSNTNGFRVVGCTTSMDCRAPQSVCDDMTNTCRGCAVATQTTDCTAPNTACNSATSQCTAPMVAVVNPANNSTTTERRPGVSGTATPGQTVTVRIDGMDAGTAVADAMGNWTFVLTADLALGMHMVVGRIAIGAMNTDSTANAFTVQGCMSAADCSGATPICDSMTRQCRACMPMASADCPTTAAPFCSTSGATSGTCVPTPPVVISPAAGSTTTSPQPPIRGTGPANATIEVVLDGMAIGRTMSDSMGAWLLMPTMSIAVGVHNVSAAVVTGGVVGPLGNSNAFTVTACMSNADCSGATPVCTSGVCRPCNPAMEATDCTPARPSCVATGPNAGMCVARAPSVTTPANGATIASRRPDVVGVAMPSTTVAVFVDGAEIGRAMVDAMGNFRLPTTADLTLGMHTVGAAAVDMSGTVGMPGMANTFTVAACSATVLCTGGTPVCDATSMMCRPCAAATEMMDCPNPGTPMCATTGPDMGRCVARPPAITSPANGSRTMDRRPEIQGTGQPSAMVAIFIDGVEVGRATVNAMGTFTFPLAMDLTPGMHMAAAATVDAMGTTGTPGAANTFTVPECTTDAQCGETLRCDTTMNVCVPGGGDGGMTTDAGDDAAMMGDGGMTTMDGSTETDASTDGGMTGDGSMSGDARTDARADASAGSEGGLSITGNGACSCRTPGGPVNGPSSRFTVVGLAAVGLLLRRRRRS